jgi:hypothetical protein
MDVPAYLTTFDIWRNQSTSLKIERNDKCLVASTRSMSFWTQPMSREICSSFMSVIEGPMRNRMLTVKGQIASRSYRF